MAKRPDHNDRRLAEVHNAGACLWQCTCGAGFKQRQAAADSLPGPHGFVPYVQLSSVACLSCQAP